MRTPGPRRRRPVPSSNPAGPLPAGQRFLRPLVATVLLAALLVAAPAGAGVFPPWTSAGPVLELVAAEAAVRPRAPVLAAGPGSYALAWEGDLATPDLCCPRGIFVRRFDLRGQPAGDAMRADVPSQPWDERILPTVAAGLDGGFLVAWHDLWERNVHARAYDRRDRPGAERIVNTYRAHWQIHPDARALPGGGYGVGWVVGDVGDDGVPWPHVAQGQLLDRDGEPVGGQFRLNGTVTAEDRGVALAPGPRGLLAVWLTFSLGDPQLWGRHLAPDGRPAGPQFLIAGNAPYEWDTSVCSLPDGAYLVAWPGGIRRVGPAAGGASPELGPLHEPADGEHFRRRLACSRFGEVLAVHLDVDGRVLVQAHAADGAPLGEPFAVDEEDGRIHHSPTLAVGPGGGALVAWQSDPSPPHEPFQPIETAIHGRRLQAGGDPCAAGRPGLCLQGGRHLVRVHWSNPYGEGAGVAGARRLSDDGAAFWFFRDGNLELMTKVLDGGPVNGHRWVFANALSTVEHWVEVADVATGVARLYHSPPFQRTGHADTAAFAGGAAPAPATARPPLPGPTGAELTPEPFCLPAPTRLCLGDGRFAVEVEWSTGGDGGTAGALPLTGDSGAFWFFREGNPELLVKVLDGRPVNGHFWVSWAGLTTVAHTVWVTDLRSGSSRSYPHSGGSLGGLLDTEAFADTGAAEAGGR